MPLLRRGRAQTLGRPVAAASAQAQRTRPGPGARLRAWVTHHLRVGVASLGYAARAPLSSALTIGVIAIALALPGTLLLAAGQFQAAVGHWEGSAHFRLFLKPGLNATAVQELAQRLKADHRFAAIEIVSPEDAAREFRTLPGFAAALDVLPENPFPYVLQLQLATPAPAVVSGDVAGLEALAQELRRLPQADQVQYDRQWLLRLTALLDLARRVAVIIGGLLSVAVLLVIGNTIRLDIYNRREEILVMKLVGATDAFIRRGFLYEGLGFGVLGGAVAWLLVLGAMGLASGPAGQLAASYGARLDLGSSWLPLGGGLIASGGLLGWLGAWLAVSHHLKDIEP